MSFSNDLKTGTSMFFDPLNISGTRDRVGGGSTIGPTAGASMTDPSLRAPPDNPNQPFPYEGFLAGIAPRDKMASKITTQTQIAAPPPPQWAWVNGQGPVWQTPGSRINSGQTYNMVNNAIGTPGFYTGGNRI